MRQQGQAARCDFLLHLQISTSIVLCQHQTRCFHGTVRTVFHFCERKINHPHSSLGRSANEGHPSDKRNGFRWDPGGWHNAFLARVSVGESFLFLEKEIRSHALFESLDPTINSPDHCTAAYPRDRKLTASAFTLPSLLFMRTFVRCLLLFPYR